MSVCEVNTDQPKHRNYQRQNSRDHQQDGTAQHSGKNLLLSKEKGTGGDEQDMRNRCRTSRFVPEMPCRNKTMKSPAAASSVTEPMKKSIPTGTLSFGGAWLRSFPRPINVTHDPPTRGTNSTVKNARHSFAPTAGQPSRCFLDAGTAGSKDDVVPPSCCSWEFVRNQMV